MRMGYLPWLLVSSSIAWAIPDKLEDASREGVKKAALVGWEVLNKGGTAVDAVTEAVKCLEDNPVFDAGKGSVLTAAGTVEMDALIMDGKNLDCGSVAAVNNIKNPVVLARKVMEKTPHTLIVGEGANILAKEENLEEVDKEYLVTPKGVEEWETYKKYNTTVSSLFGQRGHDTVGVVTKAKNQEMNGNIQGQNTILASSSNLFGIARKFGPTMVRQIKGMYPQNVFHWDEHGISAHQEDVRAGSKSSAWWQEPPSRYSKVYF